MTVYATTDFVHLDLTVSAGDKFPDDHPMVVLRPDLFSTKKPTKGDPSTDKEP